MTWLVVLAAFAVIAWGLRALPRETDDDWTLPEFRGPFLDRAELLEAPFVSGLTDEDLLAALEEIRGLPEVAA